MPRKNERRMREGLVERRVVADAAGLTRAVDAIAAAILERHPSPRDLVLVGIRSGGAPLAERLQKALRGRSDVAVPLGAMDITLYRDDVFTGLPRPEVGATQIPCALEGRVVVLVDDVLFTGRTIRAALSELMDFGRPAAVELAVLVDRGHRELPIQPDYVGLVVETTRDQSIAVQLAELGESDRVVLYEKPRP